jgi:hypothetical protein
MDMLAKIEAVTAIASLPLVLCGGIVRIIATRAGVAAKTAELLSWAWMLGFFLVFGLSCIGLMIHAFIVLQARIGNGGAPMVRFLAAHETGVTFAFWGVLGTGALIAFPFALGDLGFKLPLRSQGVLVADIGMTLDEVRARSSLKIKEPHRMGDRSFLDVEDRVFDYRIGLSGVLFAKSRYYWLQAQKADPRITAINIGISPEKMSSAELDAFQRRLQEQLANDGWIPGHFLAHSEETVHLWGGKQTAGDGRYWAKGNTLLIFETKRMDEQKRDEAPNAGEFILYLDLRPRDHERDLVFEPSAWKK